jgi:3-deoxy-7-phosphoheptulonate synthase
MAEWSPTSWKSKPAEQQPLYPREDEAARVVDEISKLPPLVTSWEIHALRTQLAEAARGERFLLQGGDCAERYDHCDSGTIANKLKILLQMSLVLALGGQRRVIRVGRFAGQYAKPRSDEFETRNGVTLPSYRGDLINAPEFTAAARTPDPQLMLRGYERAALTLNFIRALVSRGFVDPARLDYWNLDWVKDSPMAEEYRRIARQIGESIRFMESLMGVHPGELQWIDFFTSHEGLHLLYEQAQTRRVPRQEGWYDLSTHFPWIGMRTADPRGAHVEFFRGIRNPIGVKIGPGMRAPRCGDRRSSAPGRRTGPPHADSSLRRGLHRPVSAAADRGRARDGQDGAVVLRSHARQYAYHGGWHQDPQLRGDPGRARPGLRHSCGVRKPAGRHPHRGDRRERDGVHRGARGLREADLKLAYESGLDPRLNYEQALEMALFISRKMSGERSPESGVRIRLPARRQLLLSTPDFFFRPPMNAVAAFAFGAVQRLVRGVQQRLGGSLSAVLDHAKAGGYGECAAIR